MKQASSTAGECHICKQSSPSTSSGSQVFVCSSVWLAKSNTGVGQQKVNWIQCDCCKKWYHSVCCGLLRKEHTKLAKDTQFFKCIICCIRAVPESARKLCAEILDDNKLIHSDLHKSSYSVIDSPSTAVASSPLTEVSGSTSSTVCSSQSTSRNSESPAAVTCGVLVENSQQEENKDIVFDSQPYVDKILIIDNINNPIEFSSSRRILQEIHNYFPLLKVDFAYSLARGGVAIHVTCKSDRDL